MRTQISQGENGLALCIPPECVEAAGLQAGDAIDIEVMPGGELHLIPIVKTHFDKDRFLAELEALHSNMPATEPNIERMRDEARY